MKTFKRILTCTVPLFISTFFLPISAHAIESNEVVVTTEAQAPSGVETTTTVVTKQSNTTEVNFELKSKLEDIHKQLSQFAKSEIDCNIDFKEGLVVFASLDQAVLDEVNTYCVNNGIDGALVQLVLIEPEKDTTVVTTEAQAPSGVETTTTVVTKQSNTTEVNFELKSKLEDIHKQLSQFAKSEIDCNIDFKEGLVVFASLDQAVLDEVNTYCVNNGIDGALVQLVLIEPEKDTTVVTTIGTQTETTITTTTTNETTLPQTGYSNSYRWLVGLSSLMTVTGAGILIRTRKKEK